MSKYKVSVIRCDGYDDKDLVYAHVKKSIDLLGGTKKFFKHGDNVLLKPNLLSAREPETAVTTHPEIIRAIARLVQEAGGVVLLGDSSAEMIFDSKKGIEKVFRKTGIEKIAKELNIRLIRFEKSAHIKTARGCLFKELEIAKEVLGVDVIINLPKFKTHSQMLMTLAVKNLFGCVVGKRKVQWHYKAGRDRHYFCSMLVDIYKTIKPSLTIMDAIVGLEGDGPGSSGTPRHLGFIMAGRGCTAIDRVAVEILQISPETLPTLKVALDRNDPEALLENIDILGEDIKNILIKDFQFPTTLLDLEFGPKLLRTVIKNSLTCKPVVDKEKCTLCGSCASSCPTDVIKITKKKLTINYDECIQCYCCIEVCPEGAMKTKKGLMTRLID